LPQLRDRSVLDVDPGDDDCSGRIGRHFALAREADRRDLMAGSAQRRQDRGIGDLEAGIGPGDRDERGEEGEAQGTGPRRERLSLPIAATGQASRFAMLNKAAPA